MSTFDGRSRHHSPRTALILGRDAIVDVVDDVGLSELLDELIDRLRAACRDADPTRLATFDRAGFRYDKPDLGLIEWMPAMELGNRVSIKTVGYHPVNPVERGLPSVLATTSIHDTTDGRLLALCESTFLTAFRTGAASAVATDVLAVPDASTVGMVGCGAQAVTQIHAISRVRAIERIIATDVDASVSATLGRRLPDDLGDRLVVVPTDEIDALVGESDILCTATSVDIEAGPVIPDAGHVPWLHVNAVGADFPGKHELPIGLLRRALVCPDVTTQCLLEGESQRLAPTELGPDLATLVRDRNEWSSSRDRLTVFDSTGWAIEDLVAAELVVDHARRIGTGEEIELQFAGADPYDPYELLRR